MQVAYRRNLNHSYMVIQSEEVSSGYETEMFLHNQIQGFLPLEMVLSNGKSQYWYEITGRQSLDAWLETTKMRAEILRSLVWKIHEICEQAQRYLLDMDAIVFDAEHIFLRNGSNDISFCYLPTEKRPATNRFKQLAEYLLQKLDHTDEEAVQFGYQVYQLTVDDGFGLDVMMEQIKTWNTHRSEENEETFHTQESMTKAYEAESAEHVQEQSLELYDMHTNAASPTKGMKRFIEKLGLGGGLHHKKQNADTSEFFLHQEKEPEKKKVPTEELGELCGRPMGELHYIGTGAETDFKLEKEIFLIGSSEDAVDGVLLSGKVSRIHAKIAKEGGDYYLEDMNSTNGTFLNGEEVNYKTPIMLQIRDRVRFADEEYIFY